MVDRTIFCDNNKYSSLGLKDYVEYSFNYFLVGIRPCCGMQTLPGKLRNRLVSLDRFDGVLETWETLRVLPETAIDCSLQQFCHSIFQTTCSEDNMFDYYMQGRKRPRVVLPYMGYYVTYWETTFCSFGLSLSFFGGSVKTQNNYLRLRHTT